MSFQLRGYFRQTLEWTIRILWACAFRKMNVAGQFWKRF